MCRMLSAVRCSMSFSVTASRTVRWATRCMACIDDLEMLLGDYQMKREGSQGQTKTFVLALKLAQFDFLRRTASQTTPLLLLDDIFDKLDSHRVEQIVKLVSGDGFGQIFITDTNREHLDRILDSVSYDYKLFDVKGGEIVAHQPTNK